MRCAVLNPYKTPVQILKADSGLVSFALTRMRCRLISNKYERWTRIVSESSKCSSFFDLEMDLYYIRDYGLELIHSIIVIHGLLSSKRHKCSLCRRDGMVKEIHV